MLPQLLIPRINAIGEPMLFRLTGVTVVPFSKIGTPPLKPMLLPLSLRSTSTLGVTELVPKGKEYPPLAHRTKATFGSWSLLGTAVPTMVPKSLMPEGVIKPGPRLGILTPSSPWKK